MPWPSQDGGGMDGSGDGVGDLDAQLDESLGEFDETVMGDGGGGAGEEIDILSPMGGGDSGAESDAPLFEEGDLGEEGGLYENESIAQRAAEGGASGASGQSGGSQEGGQESASSSMGGGGGAAAPQGEMNGAASGGSGEEATDIVPIPDDIGDGRNDDIVLRQIRDAAMKETDPVLREKLWDEYRRIRDQR